MGKFVIHLPDDADDARNETDVRRDGARPDAEGAASDRLIEYPRHDRTVRIEDILDAGSGVDAAGSDNAAEAGGTQSRDDGRMDAGSGVDAAGSDHAVKSAEGADAHGSIDAAGTAAQLDADPLDPAAAGGIESDVVGAAYSLGAAFEAAKAERAARIASGKVRPEKTPRRMHGGGRSRRWLIGLVILAIAVVGIACGFGIHAIRSNREEAAAVSAQADRLRREAREQEITELLARKTFYPGARVAGVDLGGKTRAEAEKLLAPKAADLRGKVKIEVDCSGKGMRYTLTEDSFAFTTNLPAALDEAYNLGREGEREARYAAIEQLAKKPVDIPLTCTISREAMAKSAKALADQIDIPVTEPKVSSFMPKEMQFVISDGKDGLKLDQADLAEKLAKLFGLDKADKRTRTAESKTTGKAIGIASVVKPKKTVDDIPRRAELLGAFSTTSTNTANGNANMKLALGSFNGKVLQPGETFSFNGSTGDTTTGKLGYKKAGAISGGKMTEAYGGGICQASTTLYGAVLRADLEVVERHNHTWPSTYVPIGQDASVNYGSTDFRFKNSSENPIYLSASMSGRKLTVEIYGTRKGDWDTIKIESKRTETIKAGSAITQNDSTLAKGKRVTERAAKNGSRAKAWKVYYKKGKEVRRTAIASSYYPPVRQIVRVGTKG